MPAVAARKQAAPAPEMKAAPIPAVADADKIGQPVPAVVEVEKKAPPALPAQERVATAERASVPATSADSIAALKSAADAGNRQAQARLGDLYGEGKGVPRDIAAAEGRYEKAALQGDVGAQLKLGAIYANAGGNPRNNNLAYVWYGTALKMGSSAAKAERDRIGALLQPAEREQADKLIDSKVARMPKAP